MASIHRTRGRKPIALGSLRCAYRAGPDVYAFSLPSRLDPLVSYTLELSRREAAALSVYIARQHRRGRRHLT